MANKSVFAPTVGKLLPRPDSRNQHMAPAYDYGPRHKLAQLAVTGCLNGTFYAEAREQLDVVLALTAEVEPAFIAKTAIHCRERGHMKDMPALLAASLSVVGPKYLPKVFARVIDNGRMLRNFVQIMRSGAVGRKSLGSRPKLLVAEWLNSASDTQLLRASVGQSPSLADVIKMVHPKPKDARREALFAWILGKPCDLELLPANLRDFLRFKQTLTGPLPDVPFQMLTALPLERKHWTRIARKGGWQMMRMNLNAFARHGVFEHKNVTAEIAGRLGNAEQIGKARVFPYQLMAARTHLIERVPREIREGLDRAMEIAIANVPAVKGSVVVCPDVSASMMWPVTGYRRGSSSTVRCIDVAALMTAAMLRRNPKARVLPFEHRVVPLGLDPDDPVQANAAKLAAVGGGGTDCSAPLAMLNKERARVDLVVLFSDNQSWVDAFRPGATGTMREWAALKARNPEAKLVCIDLQPHGTAQAPDRDDILNVGGFSDAVFELVAGFAKGELDADHWVGEIEKVTL